MQHDYAATNDGWGGYPDARETIGGLGAFGEVDPSPVTPGYDPGGDARQQAVNNPDQVRQDAENLRLLDYPAPDTGNAYDPSFRSAVKSFQVDQGLTADGLIGPNTRSALVAAVAPLKFGPPPPPSPTPGPIVPIPPNILPGPAPAPGPSPAPHPSPLAKQDHTQRNVLIACGVIGGAGLLWWLFK